ncbi:IS30 family transposase [uncultured Microbacterium sp.]|uniref:IS30 family transposase n=1 Tax=uncultured Microbacterium sp. TaxID=191216 RepID=UPI00261B35D7|nr:IS30 family transposase [uncultured Microbacterium sp.]
MKLLHLPAHSSTELLTALVRTLNELPPPLRRSVPWDQGTEMARHLDITQATGTRIYFCDAASPWQRGSNENTNGLLEWSPKAGLRN